MSLSTGAEASNNVILPLHRFYFFNSFFDQIAPNGEVSFDMNFESDANVLFTAAGLDVGRCGQLLRQQSAVTSGWYIPDITR